MPTEPETEAGNLVYALTVAAGVGFAARASGLYRSVDGGQTWHSAYGALTLSAPLVTLTVAASPAFATDRTVVAGVSGGVLVSTDGGDHWQAIIFPMPDCAVTTLAFSPNFAQDGVILAGTLEDGFFRSTDRGRYWTSANFGLLDAAVLCLAVSPNYTQDETVWAGTATGLFRSTNGGRSWREAAFPADDAPVLSLAVSPRFAEDGLLFAGTEPGTLLRSTDGGEQWTPVNGQRPAGPVNSVQWTARDAGLSLVALIDEAVHLSSDGGQTWADWSTQEGVSAVYAPPTLPAGSPLLVGYAGGAVQWAPPGAA